MTSIVPHIPDGPYAKVLADSVSPDGQRLTTLEVRMHRFVLAEFNTHRVFSRNSASSRAIPIARTLAALEESPALPAVWTSEKPGMQGGPPLEGDDLFDARQLWDDVLHYTTRKVWDYVESHPVGSDGRTRLHKSLLNRLLEPFMWHTVIVTSTDWDNFFALRCHPDAQPEIRIAADLMRIAMHASTPRKIGYGQWHVPFIGAADRANGLTLEEALKMSAARCAWVSTLKHGKEATRDDIEGIYAQLTAGLHNDDPIHASPFEHQATPMPAGAVVPGNFRGWAQLRHMIEAGEPPWETLRGDVVDRDGKPMPVASDAPIAHRMVQADLEERLRVGLARYGKPLQPFNGRDSLRDAYDEILDLAVYLRTLIHEEENDGRR